MTEPKHTLSLDVPIGDDGTGSARVGTSLEKVLGVEVPEGMKGSYKPHPERKGATLVMVEGEPGSTVTVTVKMSENREKGVPR